MLPIDIKLHQKSKRLELSFSDSRIYSFSYEFLRVHSPSAEVRGHSPSQAVLQLDKVSVGVKEVELVGAYALKITFDDGHNTGLYTWTISESYMTIKNSTGTIICRSLLRWDMIGNFG